MASEIFEKLRLHSNPFEPSATGAPISGALTPPNQLAERTMALLEVHQPAKGVKAIVLVGEYGTGKTCLLHWLHRAIFPVRKIKSFYFDNPGVQFYDLANSLLRNIGRKDFAKFIWELAGAHVSGPVQGNLFQKGYEEYLFASYRRRPQADMARPLQDAIRSADVTNDEEIAYCLARIVTEVVKKPYFEYQDFVPRQKNSVVPEGEEAPYFRAILKTISRGTGAQAVAFLVDEFEEIGLQKRLTKRAAHDYLATLKRLINLAQSEQIDFWIVLSMTPDAFETTKELEPALIQRISDRILEVQPFTATDASDLIRARLADARPAGIPQPTTASFPFPDEIGFRPTTYSNPRRLVKACFRAIADADRSVQLPFTEQYLHRVEDELYPNTIASGSTTP